MGKSVRHIVRIDEEKCNGCGVCVPSCAEGALKIVEGKARLVSEVYCDGLGACLGHCPQGAITIEERPADEFDEEAVKRHAGARPAAAPAEPPAPPVEPVRRACPVHHAAPEATVAGGLSSFPIQLGLVSPNAPFLRGADLLLAADCTGYAFPRLRDLARGHVLLIACPKLDDAQEHLEKLTAIVRQSEVKSIMVVRMEVPCCSGLVRIAEMAVERSGRDIPVGVIVAGIDGELKEL